MTFFSPQLDYSKKLLKTKFTFRAEAYVWEYLIAIKSTNENKYEMLITKIRSFFCNFNNYLDRQMRPVERVRHTIISKLQREN